MKVLILGGTCFVGPPVVQRLTARGHEVTVFHRGKTQASLPTEVRHIYGDRARLSEALPEFRRFAPDVVVDMNAYSRNDGERLASLFKGVAQRLVVISSADVYRARDRFCRIDPGPADPAPLTEESPLRDRMFPYADRQPEPLEAGAVYEKIWMERAASADPALPTTIVRLPQVYGPGDYQHRCFGYLKRMEDRRPVILLPQDIAAWCAPRGYVEDMGEAVALAATCEAAVGRTYHVADREILTEAEWVVRIGHAAGWSGKLLPLPNTLLPPFLQHSFDASQHWSLDSSRIRAELGYRELATPDEAMQRTVEWEYAHPPADLDLTQFDYAVEDAALKAAMG